MASCSARASAAYIKETGIGKLQLALGGGANYQLAYANSSNNRILQKEVSLVSVRAADKVYDGGTAAAIVDGTLLGDQFDGAGFARGVARKGFDAKGKWALVVGNGNTPLAHCHHVAITQPREQAAA